MILLKMGGSVITCKSVPLSFQKDAVVALGEVVYKIAESEPVILVHGGGSFGHHYSVMYDMHTAPARYTLDGFSIVRNSMVHLHHLVLDALTEGGVTPYSCPPSILIHSPDAPYTDPGEPIQSEGVRVMPERVEETAAIARSGMSPVVYGDAMWCGDKTSCILSGDAIMTLLAKRLAIRLAIFATDVDGVYTSLSSGHLIQQADRNTLDNMATPTDGPSDVTGGMLRKVIAASDISKTGTDVVILNGNKPQRIADAVQGTYNGTLFLGVKA